jgi:hypothetical protein
MSVLISRGQSRKWWALWVLMVALGLASALQLGGTALAQEEPDVLATADALLGRVSQVTGLSIKNQVKKQILNRSQIRKYLEESLHAEYTPHEIYVQEATLRAFGLVSADFSLEKFLLGFYTEQAAGFYDPRQKTLFLTDDLAPEMQTLVLAHELTHALQDQNYDLQKFLRAERANDDATNARQALTEGHAMAVTLQIMVQPLDLSSLPDLGPIMASTMQQQMEGFPAFLSAPAFLRKQMTFPYLEGVDFARNLVAQGGWEKANAAFVNPPHTTQEIFDPKFYLEPRPRTKLDLPRLPPLAEATKLQVLTENVMGQLGYYGLLEQFISEDEAKNVAPGWVADRYILYDRTADGTASPPAPDRGGYILVARVRWTSSENALAFFHDYQTILHRKYASATMDPRANADVFLGSAPQGHIILLRKDTDCLWAEGVPAAQAEAMLDWLRSL